jgi:hypothetical protein
MSINLPTNFETLSPEELLILSGFKSPDSYQSSLPTLRVNYEDADDDGNDLPRGQWTISHEGVRVFGKVARLRPIVSTLQYRHFDKDKKAIVSTSVHFNSFNQEIPDDTGGYKCGKVTRKKYETLSPVEQAIQKEIKLSRVIFGLVSIDGVNQKGEPTTVENLPCVFYARGTNYMPMDNFFKSIEGVVLPQEIEIVMSLKREKPDGVVFWVVEPSYDKKNKLKVDKEIFDLMRKFSDTVKAENDQIVDKFSKVRAKGISAPQSAFMQVIEGASDSLELKDDEIPF